MGLHSKPKPANFWTPALSSTPPNPPATVPPDVPSFRVRGRRTMVPMQSMVIEVNTGRDEVVHDLTPHCAAFLREAAAGRDGLLHVFVPHATAGIALIELGA